MGVVVDRETADVGHHRLVKNFPQPGQIPGDHRLHPRVLQAHGVEHPGGRLSDAGGGVAEARVPGGALEGECPQAVDVVQLRELHPVPEGAAGGDHRVIQPDAGEHHARIYHMISSFSSTGPSLQMRLLPYFVLQLHPIQAPKPQPIRSSKLSRPEEAAAPHTAFSMGSGPQAQK